LPTIPVPTLVTPTAAISALAYALQATALVPIVPPPVATAVVPPIATVSGLFLPLW
jgi:hypothetical protein